MLVWLQFQDCAGCSESMLRSSHPEIADIVLDLFSWEYHEVIMAGSGTHATAALDRIVKEEKGKYLVVVEGGIRLARAAHIAPSAAARRSKSPSRSAATPPSPLPWERAPPMAVSCARTPIRPAHSA